MGSEDARTAPRPVVLGHSSAATDGGRSKFTVGFFVRGLARGSDAAEVTAALSASHTSATSEVEVRSRPVSCSKRRSYNAVAKNHYMSGGQARMPITIRAAAGCIGVAAQHSQCLWGTLAHLPGPKVVAPSNPYDYRGLLAAAALSENAP